MRLKKLSSKSNTQQQADDNHVAFSGFFASNDNMLMSVQRPWHLFWYTYDRQYIQVHRSRL